MNLALESSLAQVETFRASHYRPKPIISAADIELAEVLAGKRKKPRRRRAGGAVLTVSKRLETDPFRRGLAFKYWNHYRWQLDICEIINVASPGYLAHLAEVSPIYSEPLRERWELWCKRPENYIAQPVRMNFWDYWQAWVDAGELNRFKADIYSRRSGLVRTHFTQVYCLNRECRMPGVNFQIRYTLVRTDDGTVIDLIPTVDDKADPAGEAGRYSQGLAVVRRRCPWCGEHTVHGIEVESTSEKEAVTQ
jgi:hypothetical protein